MSIISVHLSTVQLLDVWIYLSSGQQLARMFRLKFFESNQDLSLSSRSSGFLMQPVNLGLLISIPHLAN